MILNLNSRSTDQTIEIGKKLGSLLNGTELILLSGDLGMGKTLITKGIAKGLGISVNEIVSPTFTLQNRYFSDKTKTYLCHFDLYRLGDSTIENLKLTSPEIDEELGENIIAVEWAQYLHQSYFKVPNVIKVDITIPGNDLNERKIIIETKGSCKNNLDFTLDLERIFSVG